MKTPTRPPAMDAFVAFVVAGDVCACVGTTETVLFTGTTFHNRSRHADRVFAVRQVTGMRNVGPSLFPRYFRWVYPAAGSAQFLMPPLRKLIPVGPAGRGIAEGYFSDAAGI